MLSILDMGIQAVLCISHGTHHLLCGPGLWTHSTSSSQSPPSQ